MGLLLTPMFAAGQSQPRWVQIPSGTPNAFSIFARILPKNPLRRVTRLDLQNADAYFELAKACFALNRLS